MVKLTAVGAPVLYSCHLVLLLIGVLVYLWLFLEKSQTENLKTKEFWSPDRCKSCYIKALDNEIGDDELSMSPCACFFKDTQSKGGFDYPKECSEKQTLQTCSFSNGTQVVGVTQPVTNTTCVFWKEVDGMTLSAHSNVHPTGRINLEDALLYLTIFFGLNLLIFIIMLYRAKEEIDFFKFSTTTVIVFLVCSTVLIRGMIGIYYQTKQTYGDVECYKMLIPNKEEMRFIILAIGSAVPGLFLVIWIFWVISMCRFPCGELACPITPILFIEIILCIYCFVYIEDLHFYIIVGIGAFEHLALMALILYKRRCRCPCFAVSEDRNTFRTDRSDSGWLRPVTETEPYGEEAQMASMYYPVMSDIAGKERLGEMDHPVLEGELEGQSSFEENAAEQWEDVLTKAKCGACINSFRQGDFTLMEEWVSLTEADLKEIGLKKGTIMRFKKHFHKDWTPPLSEAELAKQYGRKMAEKFSKKLREEYLPLFTDVKKILDDSQKGLNIEAPDLLKIDDKDLYNNMVYTRSALIKHGIMVEAFCADGIGKLEAALLKFQQDKFDKGLSIVQNWFAEAETSLTRHVEKTTILTQELQVTIDKVLKKVETSKEFVENATRWNTNWKTGCKVVLGVSAVCLLIGAAVATGGAIIGPAADVVSGAITGHTGRIIGLVAICGLSVCGLLDMYINSEEENINRNEATADGLQNLSEHLKKLRCSLNNVRKQMLNFKRILSKAISSNEIETVFDKHIKKNLCDFFGDHLESLVASLTNYFNSGRKLVETSQKLEFVFVEPASSCIIS